MCPKPVQTQDGSWTCWNETYQEHYHNLAGAALEADSLYGRHTDFARLFQKKAHVRILDPFFGMGYNSLAALRRFQAWRSEHAGHGTVSLVALENDPDILALNIESFQSSTLYPMKSFPGPSEHNTYYQTLPGWNSLEIDFDCDLKNDGFALRLYCADTRQILPGLPDQAFDVIYHDPFSPRKQPELWTRQLFEHYYRVLSPEGQVLTYSASAAIRQAMRQVGFSVYRLSTATGKFGTLASRTPEADALPLSDLENDLMDSKSGIAYTDSPHLNWPPEQIRLVREENIQQSTLPTSSSVHKSFYV